MRVKHSHNEYAVRFRKVEDYVALRLESMQSGAKFVATVAHQRIGFQQFKRFLEDAEIAGCLITL